MLGFSIPIKNTIKLNSINDYAINLLLTEVAKVNIFWGIIAPPGSPRVLS